MNLATPPKMAPGGRSVFPFASALAAATLLFAPSPVAQAEVLSNNLGKPTDGIEKVTNARWLGSQFTTDGKSYLLTDIRLKLQRNVSGIFEAAVFTDANGHPGTLIGTLDARGQITTTLNEVPFQAGEASTTSFETTVGSVQFSGTFAVPKGVKIAGVPGGSFTASGQQPAGLTLAPNSTYWIVLRAASGEFASGYTDSEQGAGIGYSSIWAQSSNAGGSWLTQNTSPLFLGINGDPTVITLELRTDFDAIQSAIFSGLPMAMAQREIILSAIDVTKRDINERLFRMRSGMEVQKGWEVFVTGRYGGADLETALPTSGFQADTWSGTVGAEYHDALHLTLGAALTLMESENALGIGVGDVDLTGYALAAYVSYTNRGFYADLLYQFSSFSHDLARNTLFGEIARAYPESTAHTIELNVGFNIEAHGFITGPLASLTYTTGDLDSYTEHGGATKNVRVDGQNFESLVSLLGWQVSKTFTVKQTKVTPQARLAWRHEFLNDSEQVNLGLRQSPFSVGNGTNFTRVGRFDVASNTEPPSRDSLELGLGVAVELSQRTALFIDYDARIFQGDGVQHSISLTGAVRF